MISIIVPCYNEEKNLKKLVNKFDEFNHKQYDLELILVNNGSTDNSALLMKYLKQKYSYVRTKSVKTNQGYGYGILSGLSIAKGDYLGWIHADLQFEPKEICKAIDYLKQNHFPNKIFIKGKRQNRPLIDNFFTICMSLYESILLKEKLWDINAQPIVFSRDLYEKWNEPPYDFSLDLYAYYTAVKNNYKIWRFNVKQHNRESGISSWNTGMGARFQLIKRVIKYSINLKNMKALGNQ